jgi:monomeric isocitrate dehydrogenase
MSIIPEFLQRKKSMEELEEENEYMDVQLSIAQKKAAIRQLQAKGGQISDFKEKGKGINFKKIIEWIKTH